MDSCSEDSQSVLYSTSTLLDRLAEGYKRAIDIIWGPLAKNGILGWNPILDQNHVPAKTGQSCAKKKLPFFQNKYQSFNWF